MSIRLDMNRNLKNAMIITSSKKIIEDQKAKDASKISTKERRGKKDGKA